MRESSCEMAEALVAIAGRRKERRKMLASLIAASSLDVTAKGMSRADPDFDKRGSNFDVSYPSAHNTNNPLLKRKYKIDTSLLGGSTSLQRSRQRKKESKETELKRRRKEDSVVEALFPRSPTDREFEANPTTPLLCNHVKLILRTLLNKSAIQPAAFNNSLVVFDDTAVQAIAIVVEEVVRGHMDDWESKLVPLLTRKQEVRSSSEEARAPKIAKEEESLDDLFQDSD